MIEQAMAMITPLMGTRPPCRALGVAPATIYRWRKPKRAPLPRARSTSAQALSEIERAAVLSELHGERFLDASSAEVYATLLDEGRYLCSERTMYRLLAVRGEVRERRNQLTHPAYARPELLAGEPNEVWSWDTSKLKGPAKWTTSTSTPSWTSFPATWWAGRCSTENRPRSPRTSSPRRLPSRRSCPAA